ncbi:hypothetical protein AFLA_013419 [Aspergillus flavus NRRL3357]|nr:hypothetical protein AFLA_013419 [Aspergillus flavus NRRL3357]
MSYQQPYQQPPPPQGYYPPPGGQYPPPQPMQYQQPPPQEEKKDRGCLTACLMAMCCCFLCEETCECCIESLPFDETVVSTVRDPFEILSSLLQLPSSSLSQPITILSTRIWYRWTRYVLQETNPVRLSVKHRLQILDDAARQVLIGIAALGREDTQIALFEAR